MRREAALLAALLAAYTWTVSLDNGLVRRAIRLAPNAATVALDNRMTGASEIRSVRPEAVVEIDGRRYDVGGLVGREVHNYLLPAWVDALRADPAAFRFVRHETGRTRERFPWKRRPEWSSRELPWPPPGVSLTLEFASPEGAGLEAAVLVHYEIYDGIPLLAKWIEVQNRGRAPFRLNRFVGEILATVETNSFVGVRDPAEFTADPRSIHVETDYSFGDGMTARVAAAGVHWKPNPLYATQVNYARQTPCLLETHPALGPDQAVPPVLLHDSTERERRGLALRRMYRTLAPWSQENPVLMHVRSAEPAAVRLAVDQAADAGFELVILTFGSGFDIENEDRAYLAGIRDLVEYARRKGVALGGYSLLASRTISEADDVVNPKTGRPGDFAAFGNSPCLVSRWGQDYFRKRTCCTCADPTDATGTASCTSTPRGRRGASPPSTARSTRTSSGRSAFPSATRASAGWRSCARPTARPAASPWRRTGASRSPSGCPRAAAPSS